MFSSLASLIFGSNTSATTNSEENNHQPNGGEEGQNQEFNDQRENLTRIDEANTINVTSSTPSVTGTRSINDTATTTAVRQVGKRNNSNNNNNRRNKNNRQRRQAQLQQQQQQQQAKSTPSLAKLLTPNESSDEDLDENDWFIVEKEDEEDSSLPRTDSEEELSVVEVKGNHSIVPASQQQQQQRHRRQHINSHSLYSGPRPQQQRNLLQRARNSNAARNAASLSVSTLSSPLRDVAAAAGPSGSGSSDETVSRNNSLALADAECISQSLYVTAPIAIRSGGNDLLGANIGMEESWFVTPPPCFTSIGPINMETSPYENLLIEHPSMSVYHSIRSAQEAAESFVNLDLGIGGGNNVVVVGGGNANRVGDDQRPRRRPVVAATVSVASAAETAIAVRPDQTAAQPQTTRGTSARADRFTATQMKQELFARSTQKSHEKKERQYLCRGAIKRSNKARDFESRGNRQRRSDMQHCKVLSGANNNRKCCF